MNETFGSPLSLLNGAIGGASLPPGQNEAFSPTLSVRNNAGTVSGQVAFEGTHGGGPASGVPAVLSKGAAGFDRQAIAGPKGSYSVTGVPPGAIAALLNFVYAGSASGSLTWPVSPLTLIVTVCRVTRLNWEDLFVFGPASQNGVPSVLSLLPWGRPGQHTWTLNVPAGDLTAADQVQIGNYSLP
jgi:hypothetical protein